MVVPASGSSGRTAPTARGLGRAGLWSAGGRVTGRALDVVALLVLARELRPADFGLVAMAMTVILVVESATQIPLVQPILRAESPQRHHYDTAFTLGLLRAVGIGSLVVASAPLVADYYGDPRLVLLLVFLALAPATRGLFSPRLADRIRSYDLRPDFVMVVGGKCIALLVITATVAVTGSFWAIAVGTVATPVVACAVSYAFAPYRPRLSLQGWPDFADVVGWNSLNQLLSALNFQIDRIALGRFATPTDLGRYSLAGDIAALPVQALVQPMNTTWVAAFAGARERGDHGRLWLLGLNGLLFVLGPVLVTLAFLAEPLIWLVLGPDWVGLAPILTLLALAGLVSLSAWLLPPLAVVSFRADLPPKRSLVTLAVRLPMTLIGVGVAGVLGAVAARAVSGLVESVFSFRAAATLTGLQVRTQLWSIRRTVAGLLVCSGGIQVFAPEVAEAPTTFVQHLVLLGRIGFVAGGGMVAFVLTVWGVWLLEGRPPGVERHVGPLVARLAGSLWHRADRRD